MKTFIRDLFYQISDHMLLGYATFYEYKVTRYLRNKLKISGRVLDIGCGYSGKNLKKLSKRIQSGVGIDIVAPTHKFGNISFIKMSAEKTLPFPNKYFDYVTCFEVIEHIRNDKKLVKEIERVLKPQGHLILSTPYLPVMERYVGLRDKIFKKSGHVRLGYELKFFEDIKGLKITGKWFFNKGRINQLISIKLFTLLPSFLYYTLLSPLYRLLTIIMYVQDKYSKSAGADLFVVMEKT